MMNTIEAIEDIVMVNTIGDSGGTKTIDPNNRVKAKGPKGQEVVAAKKEPVASHDNVNLSDATKKLDEIKASFKGSPEVDQARVAQIKEQVDSGNYQISSLQIAKKMLNNNMELA
jgi:flagellar biosynthesis anti-sigma factor FlgM